MKSKLVALGLCSVMIIASVGTVAAQQTAPDKWAAVMALAVNEKLVVNQKDGRTLSGKMIEATDQVLTLDRNGKPFSIARADIYAIWLQKGKAQKAKWALIGTGVGAAAGTGIGATKYSSGRDDSEIWLHMGFMLGAGIGAASGAAFGATRRERELVYQAP